MSITIKNLDFSYTEQAPNPVLSIKHWTLNDAETVFLHGPSGAGKSTLLNIIGGMLPISTGEVSVIGHRLDQFKPHQRDRFRANNIGYVFQQFNLIPYLNIIDNVDLARYFYSGKKTANRKHDDIKELLASLNIDTQHWYKRADELSIGQQQRVAIARALYNQPKLMIVDEPTSSLDEKNRDDFMSVLMSNIAKLNTTLVFVSHDKSLGHYFNRKDSMLDINSLTVND